VDEIRPARPASRIESFAVSNEVEEPGHLSPSRLEGASRSCLVLEHPIESTECHERAVGIDLDRRATGHQTERVGEFLRSDAALEQAEVCRIAARVEAPELASQPTLTVAHARGVRYDERRVEGNDDRAKAFNPREDLVVAHCCGRRDHSARSIARAQTRWCALSPREVDSDDRARGQRPFTDQCHGSCGKLYRP
jgi:hypothetical protein